MTNLEESTLTKEIYLPIEIQTALPVYDIKQGDNMSRSFKIYITKDNVPTSLADWARAAIRMRRGANGLSASYIMDTVTEVHNAITRNNPDYVWIYNDDGPEKDYIINTFTATQLAVAGRNYVDIIGIGEDGTIISSIPFILNVIPAPAIGDAIIQTDSFSLLNQLISRGSTLYDNAQLVYFDIDMDSGQLILYSSDTKSGNQPFKIDDDGYLCLQIDVETIQEDNT